MSKVTVTSGNVTVEGESQKEIFEDLASFQEVFSITVCKGCGESRLRYVVREVEGNKFYELKCLTCHAKLQFGQHKGLSTLFPKSWVKWNFEDKVEEDVK
jgi:hypothetical protein